MNSSHANPPMTLDARYYVDPATYAEEMAKIFRRMWVCVGRDEELARPGDFILREIAGESLIVVRDQDGRIRAYFNVCRHRGTRICTEASGNTGHRLQCPYHAWTWDLKGGLVAAPNMDAAPGFDEADYPLHPVAADVWDGHVFLHLDPPATSLPSQLADLPEKFRHWGMSGLRRGARMEYEVAANWKLIIQNYSECLHCPVIHPALQKLSHYLSSVNEPGGIGSSYLGGRMDLREGIGSMTMTGRRVAEILPGLRGDDRTQVLYYAVMPNLLLSLHPDYVMTHVLYPQSVDRTRIVCELHFTPESLSDPDFDPGPAVEFWDLTNRQDWRISEISQPGLTSSAYRPGPYSPREELLHAFDLWLVAKLGNDTPVA